LTTHRHTIETYLDIETTGLSPHRDYITVVGIYTVNGPDTRLIQLVNPRVTESTIMEAVREADVLYTYNGSRFDLPFIEKRLGVQLDKYYKHQDLMYDCWENNLRGGLKSVERQLCIDRKLKGMNGLEAVRLWWLYYNNYDRQALQILLDYNKEDLVNLKRLKDILLGKPRK